MVAIVGRPNVGKSAIFNRITRGRSAIVHAQSGVTRDRLSHRVKWKGGNFELVDTGGVGSINRAEKDDIIASSVMKQVNSALEEAAMVLLVVDVSAGIVPMDENVADELRGSGIKTVVVANKADNEKMDNDACVFEEFGFPVFSVSALHNRGFDGLLDFIAEQFPGSGEEQDINPLKVTVTGRPNVGKSSYINRLLRSDRVIVSEVPGTTRDSIDVPFTIGSGKDARHYLLVDTAGIKRAKKTKTSVDKFSVFLAKNAIKSADVVVLVLDATQGVTAQDKKIAALVSEAKKGCVILVNKWDLQKEMTEKQYGPVVSHEMRFMSNCPILFISTKTGYNIRKSIDAVDHVASGIRNEISTGVLNRTISDACAKFQSPSVNGKHLKIFYATQVGHSPVRIRLFVNDTRLMKQSYRQYIAGCVRKKFQLAGPAVVLELRSRRSAPTKNRRGKGE